MKTKKGTKMTVTCGDIRAHIDPAQAKELEYLARWHADLQYIKERFGASDPECEVSRKSIEFAFKQLDALCVPYWLQNAALAFSEDWRRYKSTDLWSYLRRKPGYSVLEG